MNRRPDTAAVVFVDSEAPWLRPFKPGFRHCFLVMLYGDTIVTIDPLASVIEVEGHTLTEVGMTAGQYIEWLRRDAIVIVTEIKENRRRFRPPGMLTCVTVLKKILGIENRAIFTPHQLFTHLTRKYEQ